MNTDTKLDKKGMDPEETRPSPDELLARVKAEEEKSRKGKLKIFLGYAAGVGKTYKMLEDARQRKNDTDIVIAYVETHGRAETEALLQGLEVMPRRQVLYRGIKQTEMDLDAVLKRRPQLALVDEAAHTNAPESRHPKRYQDVAELLEAGIDVYATLNLQHIESVRNVVAQITGVWIRETIPDSFIDSANEIELVDLPPEELLKRLKDGKVYVPEQIRDATEKFFRLGNLTALRELTMRTAAERVDEQTRAYMETHAVKGPWPSGERLLVCINPDNLGARLARTGRRLASQLGAEWFAVYVETPDSPRLSSEQQERLTGNLRLAERMGAQVATVYGDSVVGAVREFAAKNNITKVVIGRPQRNRWMQLFRESIVDKILRQRESFDVYIVGSAGGEPVSRRRGVKTGKEEINWKGYLQGLALITAATVIGWLLGNIVTPLTIIMIYLLCVIISAIWGGLGPSIVVSILSVMAYDFFFVEPRLSFAVSDAHQYIFTFISFLVVGALISYLTARIRWQTQAVRERERRTAALYALGRDLAVLNDLESYLRAIIKRVKETFGSDTVIFLPDEQVKGTLKPYTINPDIQIDANETSAAIWSFQHQKIVGKGTDTLPDSKALYLPLVTARGTAGVMALWVSDAAGELSIEQEQLLEAYADLAAVAIEGIHGSQGTNESLR